MNMQTTPPYVAPTDVDLLRVAARRANLPFEVSVADIENLAREYDKERLAQLLRENDLPAFTSAARSAAARSASPDPLAAHEEELASLIGWEAATVIVRDLRAAAAQPEPLDVERLARALDNSASGVTGSHADALAARIVVEYARLSETPR